MPLTFTSDLETGVADVDDQHRELFAAVDAFHQTLKAKKLDGVDGVLDFLRDYVLVHFATEERHMARTAYPERDVHERQHRDLLARYVAFREAFAQSPSRLSMAVDFTVFLGQWLNVHIRGSDAAMALWIRSAGAPSATRFGDRAHPRRRTLPE
jgi:hemerythrin